MIEPKTFYRKLDFLQNKIGVEKSGKDYLITIIEELENTFGEDLRLQNGSIYEREDNEFVLLFPAEGRVVTKIGIDDPAIQLALKWKTYIYDQPVFISQDQETHLREYTTHAAFIVRNPSAQWLFVFELKSGWVREEIELCLNAVRTALNYRLSSESVKSELQQAAQIQQSLLPQSAPEFQGFEIAGISKPAELVGGDLYDYFVFNEDELGFCIGDASGHGIPAALMVRDVVIGMRMGLENNMKMVHTLKKLNSVIHQGVYSSRFISLFYGELERNGNLYYANAGHPPPLLFLESGMTQLDPTGMIIGAFPQIELTRAFIHIPKNAILVLLSDGILERKNKRGELFDNKGVIKVVNDNRKKSAQVIMEKIFKAANDFNRSSKWEDDATVIVIKRSA